MKVAALTLMVILATTAARAFDAPPPLELLSIRGLKLGRHDLIERCKVQTWGLDIVATCHIPPSWRITAGDFTDSEGVISGEGGNGVSWLDRKHLNELDDLVLVRAYGYQPRDQGDIPASFAGWVHVEDNSNKGRRIRLTPENFAVRAAGRCPVPISPH